MNRIQIVVGGQWGSEAKGAIAAHLVRTEGIDIAVRTGATNAGHTVEHAPKIEVTSASDETRVYVDGESRRYAMQQLPVGWVRPDTTLVLGAGSLIDPDILKRECAMVSEATGRDVRNRLYIDHRAYIHRREHAERSADSDRHHAIGATGKGCSEALMDRIRLRGVMDWTVGVNELFNEYNVTDTEEMLNDAYDGGAKIQLEGTQGQLLDLCLGPYPYTTHKQTGPAQWMCEAGLSPRLPTDIVMVVRTHPIRVAGNSGPMPHEVSWPGLAREINRVRAVVDMPPIVREDALLMFEEAVRAAAAHFNVPAMSDGNDMHTWSEGQRRQHRVAASELHAWALKSLADDTRTELAKLFEITTVTKKLRRIAIINIGLLEAAARQIRPNRIAVTFLNYAFPERWYSNEDVHNGAEYYYLNGIANRCKAPVTIINRGPSESHIIDVQRYE